MNKIITTLTTNHDLAMQTHFLQADVTHAWQLAGEPDTITHVVDISNISSDRDVKHVMERLEWVKKNVPFKAEFSVVTNPQNAPQ